MSSMYRSAYNVSSQRCFGRPFGRFPGTSKSKLVLQISWVRLPSDERVGRHVFNLFNVATETKTRQPIAPRLRQLFKLPFVFCHGAATFHSRALTLCVEDVEGSVILILHQTQILLLCVGASLAAEKKCKDSKVSPEIKELILDYHKDRREGDAMEWNCGFESKAEGTLKNSTTRVDWKKINRKFGFNFFEYNKADREQYTVPKDIVRFVLEHWWSNELYAKCNMKEKTIKKFGCSYKDGDVFLIACVYEKRACGK
ncbi:hypothetical protein Y032_0010g1067 [Ancylostoma ceylanicum]|nr:hypothetical protein Y032_0010g1067 [Ancylostoma ceylanicum]